MRDQELAVRDLVTAVAQQNWPQFGDWAFKDGASTEYATAAVSDAGVADYTDLPGTPFHDRMRLPVENSIGSMIALLVAAGDKANGTFDPDSNCATGVYDSSELDKELPIIGPIDPSELPVPTCVPDPPPNQLPEAPAGLALVDTGSAPPPPCGGNPTCVVQADCPYGFMCVDGCCFPPL